MKRERVSLQDIALFKRVLIFSTVGILALFGFVSLGKYCWYRSSSKVDELFRLVGSDEEVCYSDEDKLFEKRRCGHLTDVHYRFNDSIGFFVLFIQLDSAMSTSVEPWHLKRVSFPRQDSEGKH